MAWRNKGEKSVHVLVPAVVLLLVCACSIQYKFNGASINYDKIKTIQIDEFPLRTSFVWAPMRSIFNNALTDVFARQTRLTQVKRKGDLRIAGEIVGYDQINKGISTEGYASQVQLRMTVNVRFTNNKNHTQDFERRFSATTQYNSSLSLNSVQQELVEQMTQDIVDQIFNATVASW